MPSETPSSPEKYDVWDVRKYLETYYPPEMAYAEAPQLSFFADVARQVGRVDTMLEVGSGGIPYNLFAFSPAVGRIEVSDFISANLEEMRQWAQGTATHNWLPYASVTAEVISGQPADNPDTAIQLEHATRKKVTGFHHVDVRHPLIHQFPRTYPLVLSAYCVDAISPHKSDWERYMENVASVVSPGGWMALATLINTAHYTDHSHEFPVTQVNADDLHRFFSSHGFDPTTIRVQTIPAAPEDIAAGLGYEELGFAAARKIR